MGQYKWVINPHTGRLQKVLNDEELEFPENLVDLNDIEFESGTPIDGQVLTYDNDSSKWKAETPSEGGWAVSGARVRAYRNSLQSVSSDVSMEKVLFNVEQWDVNDEFSDSVFTAKEAGYYLVIGEVRYYNFMSASFPIGIGIYKNDNAQKSKDIQCAQFTVISIELSDTVYCDIGDVIDIRTTQNSGGDLNIFGIDSKVASNVIINKL